MKAVEAGQEEGEDPHYEGDAGAPDQVIDQKSDKTAANTGHGHLNSDELGCFNAKLI